MKSMYSESRDNFISSLVILMPFISFSCLIALARTSSTMMNRSAKSGIYVDKTHFWEDVGAHNALKRRM